MVYAARTMATPAATWAIVIVAVVVLAFWLSAIFVADRSQVRASGRSKAATWPSYPGAWAGGSVAGGQAPEIPRQAVHEPVGTPGTQASDAPGSRGEAPTLADIPAQPAAGGGRSAMPTMPAQRSGDADRPARSYAGRRTPDEEGQGR